MAKRKRDDPEQSKRFVKTARELESEETGKTFARAMASVLKKDIALKSQKKVRR